MALSSLIQCPQNTVGTGVSARAVFLHSQTYHIKPAIVLRLIHKSSFDRVVGDIGQFLDECFLVSHDAIVILVLPDATLTIEMSLDFVSGIAFDAMCYLGETVKRTFTLLKRLKYHMAVCIHYHASVQRVFLASVEFDTFENDGFGHIRYSESGCNGVRDRVSATWKLPVRQLPSVDTKLTDSL